MKENRFLKAESEVLDILKYQKETRKSDQLLFVKYWQKTAGKVPFVLFFLFPSLFNAHSFKTIERVRRKIQANHPELKDKETYEKRLEAQQQYEQYSLDM